MKILREFTESGMKVIEYTTDGLTISHTVKSPIETGQAPSSQKSVETMDQKIARLEKQLTEQNLMQMEVLATIYEQILGGA